MVSGLVAYGSGAQEMGEKRCRKALTSITAPQKCIAFRKATHGKHTQNAQ